MKKIGITTHIDHIHQAKEHAVNMAYIKAVMSAGGLPILIPVTNKTNMLDEYMTFIDGLIITGGGDLNPNLYQEENHGFSTNISDLRDEMEVYLLKEAIALKVPVLGICRGMQLVNVFYGGSLYQDIMTQYDTDTDHINSESEYSLEAHQVSFVSGSRLQKLMCRLTIGVNSRHHQGVKLLGKGLKVSARATDGMIEGLEHTTDDVIAVQWHPEDMVKVCGCHKQLFVDFIHHCDRGGKHDTLQK